MDSTDSPQFRTDSSQWRTESSQWQTRADSSQWRTRGDSWWNTWAWVYWQESSVSPQWRALDPQPTSSYGAAAPRQRQEDTLTREDFDDIQTFLRKGVQRSSNYTDELQSAVADSTNAPDGRAPCAPRQVRFDVVPLAIPPAIAVSTDAGEAAAHGGDATAIAVALASTAVFQIQDFESHYAIGLSHWRNHNAAMKWFRQKCEQEGEEDFIFPNDSSVEVAQIIHDKKGPNYTFDATVTTRWWWQEMIAQLDGESMEHVVRGPEGRSGGLVGCSFSARRNSYDHKRAHAIVAAGGKAQKQLTWDFVVHRADGTGIRLHPSWSSPKVESFDIAGHDSPIAVPAKGSGKSDGPGTFQHYVKLGNSRTLKFQTMQPPPRPKARA